MTILAIAAVSAFWLIVGVAIGYQLGFWTGITGGGNSRREGRQVWKS